MPLLIIHKVFIHKFSKSKETLMDRRKVCIRDKGLKKGMQDVIDILDILNTYQNNLKL